MKINGSFAFFALLVLAHAILDSRLAQAQPQVAVFYGHVDATQSIGADRPYLNHKLGGSGELIAPGTCWVLVQDYGGGRIFYSANFTSAAVWVRTGWDPQTYNPAPNVLMGTEGHPAGNGGANESKMTVDLDPVSQLPTRVLYVNASQSPGGNADWDHPALQRVCGHLVRGDL